MNGDGNGDGNDARLVMKMGKAKPHRFILNPVGGDF